MHDSNWQTFASGYFSHSQLIKISSVLRALVSSPEWLSSNCFILLDIFCYSYLSVWLCCIFLIHCLFSISSDIRAEMMPDTLPDRSEVGKFDHSKLKHVETQQKEVLPTQSGALTGFGKNMQSQGPIRVLSIIYSMNFWPKSRVDFTGGRGVGWLKIGKGCGYFGRS